MGKAVPADYVTRVTNDERWTIVFTDLSRTITKQRARSQFDLKSDPNVIKCFRVTTMKCSVLNMFN